MGISFYDMILLFTCLLSLIMCVPFVFILLHYIFPKHPKVENESVSPFIACIVTAYKDLDVAIPLVESLLHQHYQNIEIFVVADKCDTTGLNFINNAKLHVLYPSKALNSKVKSLVYAIDNFNKKFEYCLVLDPDNLVKVDTITQMVKYLDRYSFVQGKRVAKNLDSATANLDAMGEIYYNFITRNIPFRCGSSATIAGSGMMLPTEFYHRHLKSLLKKFENQLISAEDKLLQTEIVYGGYRIAFAEEAHILDEKISYSNQIKNQRTRWLLSYFSQIKDSIKLGIKGALNFDMNRMFFALVCLFPPQSLMFFAWILLFLLATLTAHLNAVLALILVLWIYVFSYLFILYLSRAPGSVYRSMMSLPILLYKMLAALFQINKAKTDFLLTEKKRLNRDE